jgi:hypothetical protein
VRAIWFAGFDTPGLHTVYVGEPMRGHAFMQAIAFVNRVLRHEPGGLVVDYLGLAHELKQALATYTESGGTGRTALDQDEAVAVMLEKYEVGCGLFHGFDRLTWVTGTPAERLGLLLPAQEYLLAQEDGKNRLLDAGRDLSQAFGLAVPHDEALRIRDVSHSCRRCVPASRRVRRARRRQPRSWTCRCGRSSRAPWLRRGGHLRRRPAEAGCVDPLLRVPGRVRGMPQLNLAVELRRKLLAGKIHTRRGTNVVQARSFAEMLEHSIRRYQNRAVEAAQVIEELIGLAEDMRAANARGEVLGLSDEELAFCDALEVNDSAVQVLGEPTLKTNARELTESVRRDVLVCTWLPTYVGTKHIVDRLIDAGIGPMRQPRSSVGYVNYVRDCRNSKSLRQYLLEAMLTFGDRDHAPGEAVTLEFTPRFAVLTPNQQPLDPRRPHGYQREAWDKLSAELARSRSTGIFQGLVVMPTGSGKTFTAVHWLLQHVVSAGGQRPVAGAPP